MLSLLQIQSSLEAGFIFALVALALFLSYSILNIADLTTNGAFTLGCAVSATVCLAGHPILALFAAMIAGSMAGFITAFLQTRLGVPSILAGIVTDTGLYTINLAVMGFSANENLFKSDTVFSLTKTLLGGTFLSGWYKLILAAVITLLISGLLAAFLGTRLGLSIRATGDNPDMVRASSINPALTITVGLCMANAMTALSGAVLAQYQKSADINVGNSMVTIALASLIIGETLFGKGGMLRCVITVFTGSIIYRFIIAIALAANIDAAFLKLISAVIVGIAISMPTLKQWGLLQKQKAEYMARRGGKRTC